MVREYRSFGGLGGNPSGQRRDERQREQVPRLPDDYLQGGYFDENGNIREHLLQNVAEVIATIFGKKEMKNHQIRAFFHHARMVENKLLSGLSFGEVKVDIKNLE
ncbi:MAG: hypothetical protein N2234_10275, partial [Planctomycetota bacterium]|nr:hypothetical protein [Planctomycetota bacterium]